MKISERNSTITVWLLTASILLYPLLTYLATPLFSVLPNGQLDVVCTLEGPQTVEVNFDALFELDSAGDEFCPALELLEQAGSASKPVLPEIPEVVFFRSGLITDNIHPVFYLVSSRAYFSRAPPESSLLT